MSIDTTTGTTTSLNGATKTSNGTPILSSTKTSALDKNAFLKILVTELSNQDPTQQKDSTQYIAQLAQFSSLEQLTNLNTNTTFAAATPNDCKAAIARHSFLAPKTGKRP